MTRRSRLVFLFGWWGYVLDAVALGILAPTHTKQPMIMTMIMLTIVIMMQMMQMMVLQWQWRSCPQRTPGAHLAPEPGWPEWPEGAWGKFCWHHLLLFPIHYSPMIFIFIIYQDQKWDVLNNMFDIRVPPNVPKLIPVPCWTFSWKIERKSANTIIGNVEWVVGLVKVVTQICLSL